MPSTLVVTVGGASSNSYATRAEGDTYAGDRLQSTAWTGASNDEKDQALLQATRRIDQEDFAGWKVDEDQALSWPRSGVVGRNGYTLDHETIPQLVKDAQIELAIQYLGAAASADPLASSGLDQFERVKVGSLEVVPRTQYTTDALSDIIRRILGPLLRRPSSATVELVRS